MYIVITYVVSPDPPWFGPTEPSDLGFVPINRHRLATDLPKVIL